MCFQDGSLPFARSINDVHSEHRLLSKLTELLMKHGEQEEALQYATLAVQVAKKTGRRAAYIGVSTSWLLSGSNNCSWLLFHRRGCEREDSLPPTGHGLLQPAAVWDGRELLHQILVSLPARHSAPYGGSLLHQGVLQTGQSDATQTEGRGRSFIFLLSSSDILSNTLNLTLC